MSLAWESHFVARSGCARIERLRDLSRDADLLDHDVIGGGLDDLLDHGVVMPFGEDEPRGVRAHGLVLAEGERDPLDAGRVGALAEKLVRMLIRSVPVGEVADALVDTPEESLVLS